MNREIKFRAWDGSRFVYLSDLSIGLEKGKKIKPYASFFTDTFNGTVSLRKHKVEQFTGFKSKTNKDIYEGDIFRQEKETDTGDIRNYLVVMWIRQRGAYYLIPVEHYQILLDNDCSKEDEFSWLFDEAALYDFSIDVGLDCVGNIHENAELLK